MTAPLVIVFGRTGQVGSELARAALPADMRLVSVARDEVDLTAPPSAIAAALDRYAGEAASVVVVNAAAYTAVDRAESEPDVCHAVNCDGAAAIAEICAARNFPLVHLSTDYVFDGRKPGPYGEDDRVGPESVYGRTKLAGEEAVRRLCPAHVVVRTSWVYSPFGTNFVKTMLRLSRERLELGIVDDQHGCPTAAGDIAAAIVAIASQIAAGKTDGFGTFHYCGEGVCTWFELAQAVFAAAGPHGHPVPRLRPITTSEYPTPARRPANSVLDCSKIREVYNIDARPWQTAVGACVDELLGAKGGV